MTVVLIDDERSFKDAPDDANVIRTVKAALEWLESKELPEIDQLWLDHDLGEIDGEVTDIMPFVKKLEEKAFFDEAPVIHMVIVHTSNPSGGDNIVAALKRFFRVERVYAGTYLEVV